MAVGLRFNLVNTIGEHFFYIKNSMVELHFARMNLGHIQQIFYQGNEFINLFVSLNNETMNRLQLVFLNG